MIACFLYFPLNVVIVFSNPAVPKDFMISILIVLEVLFFSFIPISKYIIDLFAFFEFVTNSKTETCTGSYSKLS
jgi:hypothetical protein